MSYRAAVLTCILFIPSLLTADVTLIYKTENKLSPSLPASFSEILSTSHILSAPAGRKIAVKGGKVFANTALMDIITDPSNNKVTLLDPANRHYVTTAVSQYADQLAASVPKIPSNMQALLASVKLTVDSKATGRTEAIQGIQSEEHEIVVTLGIPMGANAPLSPVMKIVMRIWRAKPEEIARNAGLQELVSSGFYSLNGVNTTDAIQKMLSQFPGIADGVASLSKEAVDTLTVMTRLHAEVSIPILAMMMPPRPASGTNAAPPADPNAPVMEINEELSSISTAPVPDSTFLVPDGYTALPIADFMSGLIPKPAPVTPKPATAPAPAAK